MKTKAYYDRRAAAIYRELERLHEHDRRDTFYGFRISKRRARLIKTFHAYRALAAHTN